MQRESDTVEFKREFTPDIRATVIAFANTYGGSIYIGIEDDGSICGIKDPDETALQTINMIRDSVCPDVMMFISSQLVEIEHKTVLQIKVAPGTSRPYYLRSKGVRPEGVFVRQGPSTVPASPAAILKMIQETSGNHYEDALSLNQELTFTETEKFFAKNRIPFSSVQKRSLHLSGAHGAWTNLGALLSDQCVHTIKVATFAGTEPAPLQSRAEFSGSLLQQFEDAFLYISKLNSTIQSRFEGVKRIDQREYPDEALREALMNAIVHRDYAFNSSTRVNILSNRIEIINVGGLVPGLLRSDIENGISEQRNPHLAHIFYRLGYIEAYGTGITTIFMSYKNSFEKPSFFISNNGFKMVLPKMQLEQKTRQEQLSPARHVTDSLHSTPSHSSKQQERRVIVEQLCNEMGFITRKNLEKALNLSQPSVLLLLRELTEAGILMKFGSGRDIRYRLNK